MTKEYTLTVSKKPITVTAPKGYALMQNGNTFTMIKSRTKKYGKKIKKLK